MDSRWPWKKKSSCKIEKAAAAASDDIGGLASAEGQGNQDYKKPKYVHISVDPYTHLTSSEEQVKAYEEQVQTLEDQITDLNEKLSEAHSEITTKENLVKQHKKVAEEAVAGWEKAEAEALALKNDLESVTLLKLTAEDKASHLDGALKECMRQIRNLKEQHEQKLQDVVLTKNKQCERIKFELEAQIANLDQEFLKSEAENAALSRSLQEHSSMLMKIGEEKSQAEAKIELLKSNIESCEREINSLKYELHVASKELEIRNEEKNMSMRSAEAVNKQHMEGVKKIAKLEAECQRLRGLVRKKLPGPAALAQMKLEVESLGRDYGDARPKRSPVKPSSPDLPPVTEVSLNKAQKFQKENEFLKERLLAMEEETKMLKEALAKRNSELQASRNLYAKTARKLQSFEAHMRMVGQQRPPSIVSVSEDGHDDEASSADSWATGLMSELSQVSKQKNVDKLNNKENANHLELLDDFLEMEKLACSSDDARMNGSIDTAVANNEDTVSAHGIVSGEDTSDKDLHPLKQDDVHVTENHASSTMYQPQRAINTGSDAEQLPVMKLQSRISMLLESISQDVDRQKVLEDLRRIVQDSHDATNQESESFISEELHCSSVTCNGGNCSEAGGSTLEKQICLTQGSKVTLETMQIIGQELGAALSQIHDFVLTLGKESSSVQDPCSNGFVTGLCEKIEEFSVTYNKVLCNNGSLADFIFELSHVLLKASKLNFNISDYKGHGVEISSPDCIEKVALPENMLFQNDVSNETYQNGCPLISNPEIPDDGNLVSDYESRTISLEEFEELKSEKANLATDLARCTENLEMTKSRLLETEQLLAEAKSQLASSQKSNSLAETQLKCMTESYRSLEARAQELEAEVERLQAKIQTLENELQGEKWSNHTALAKCNELKDQLQSFRSESCSVCPLATDNDVKTKQEGELAAAAEKLAECQQTILLLGKQLKSLQPQSEFIGSPYSERSQKGDCFPEEPTTSSTNMQEELDQDEKDRTASTGLQQTGSESSMDVHNSLYSPSGTESNLLRSSSISKHPKQRPTMSSSSSSSPAATPEKHSRGFSRFFSSKGKNGY